MSKVSISKMIVSFDCLDCPLDSFETISVYDLIDKGVPKCPNCNKDMIPLDLAEVEV